MTTYLQWETLLHRNWKGPLKSVNVNYCFACYSSKKLKFKVFANIIKCQIHTHKDFFMFKIVSLLRMPGSWTDRCGFLVSKITLPRAVENHHKYLQTKLIWQSNGFLFVADLQSAVGSLGCFLWCEGFCWAARAIKAVSKCSWP